MPRSRRQTPRPGGAWTKETRYAWGPADYHDLIRSKLTELAEFTETRLPGCRTRGVVDTAPLLERDFARLAGLGWFGKNTLLLNKRMGSWFFLAALFWRTLAAPEAQRSPDLNSYRISPYRPSVPARCHLRCNCVAYPC